MKPDHSEDKLQKLGGVIKRNRAKFIESEFSLAFTFCDLADTEYRIGNREHAETLVMRAVEAGDKAEEYLKSSDLTGVQVEEMRRQLEELQARLKELRRAA